MKQLFKYIARDYYHVYVNIDFQHDIENNVSIIIEPKYISSFYIGFGWTYNNKKLW